MGEVVYAIELNTLDTAGLTMLKTKIGKTSDIESRLSDYQTGMLGEPEVLDLWYPNPDVSLSSVENGTLDVAEQFAYNRSGEVFVFLQDEYQQFSETVDKFLCSTTREEIETNSSSTRTEGQDYTGKVPALIKLNGKTYDVSSWRECPITVAEIILSETENIEPIKQVSGRTRDYIVEEGKQYEQTKPEPISNADLYIETNLSAKNAVSVCEKILKAYNYDLANFTVLTEN